ncbi:hypothetical protein A2348_03125 [Candidatus Uhrbacteria bacterium RIFOXYB12_FULL_58_10]|uniref:Uncharacterized protein n=1 Tax=Candidatus Uhrbacteria bacterium RIFOXYB2_FULL_57_15 TaxID=1802422 RepID=A0A1F7W558_9BACT|nr:MAG: hypothetical protein A2348_03125 [Candidatus Uhrbacteria bacterium RIFOXYB12_FULL_58_10]OGL97953.1 MAG: hypothetical protein A2304_05365 [Candidatus Uhrbacteria bacterium RIFOXYB2_FULL_57_15]
MSIRDESRIIFTDDGTATLEMDRIKDGPDARRIKLLRRTVDGKALLPPSMLSKTFPEGCVFHESGAHEDIFVVECPPQVRSVTWKYGTGWDELVHAGGLPKFDLTPADRTRNQFRLAFPYMIFVVYMKDTGMRDAHLFVRPGPLHDLREPLFWPWTTNIHADTGKICFKDIPAVRLSDGPRAVERVVEEFWATAFNDHWSTWWTKYGTEVPRLRSVWEWEHWSRRNPSWVLDAPMLPFPVALWEIIEKWRREYGGASMRFGFQEMLAAARTAPLWRPAAEREGDLLMCESVAVIHNGKVIEIGTELVSQIDDPGAGLNAGEAYAVAHFYEVSKAGIRYVALTGVSRAVSLLELTGRDRDTEAVDPKRAAADTIERLRLSVGLRFRFTSCEDLADVDTRKVYEIGDLRVDPDGDVEILFGKTDPRWIFVTYGGGTLLPSVRLLFPELSAGTFTFDDFRLRVGEAGMLQGVLTRVTNIWERLEAPGTYAATFEGRGELNICSNGALQFSWNPLIFELNERHVVLGKNCLDLRDVSHLLLSKGVVVEVGGWCVSENAGHPLDLSLEVVPYNAAIPIIRNSEWVGLEGEPCAITHALPECTLSRGQRVRFVSEDILGLDAGETFEILCFCNGKSGRVEIVFSDGGSIELDSRVAGTMRIERVVGTNRFDPLSETDCESLPNGAIVNRRYVRDEVVRYLGGSASVPEEHRGKIATVVYSNVDDRTLKIRIGGMTYDGVYRKYVARVIAEAHRKFVTIVGLFGVMRSGPEIPIPKELHREHRKTTGAPHPCGKDVDKVQLHFGDFVLAQYPTDWSDGGRSVMRDAVALVVSYAPSNEMLYLYCMPEDVRIPAHRYGYTSGYENVPVEYRNSPKKERVCLNKSNGVVRLVPNGGSTESIEPGSFVSVKPEAMPRFGWGGVSPNDRGRVTQLFSDEASITFSNGTERKFLVSDLVRADPRVGDRVRIRASAIPLYGPGDAQREEEGTVVSRSTSQHLVVDFPSHPGWHAHPNELEIVAIPPLT